MSALAPEAGVELPFVDAHTFPGNQDFYPVPNENLERWETLLQGLRLYKVAGICSGGEVGFFNLLPRVQRELVLVDHSYKALYFAMVKYLALQKYGPEETYKRLTAGYARYPETTPRGAFKALAAEFDPILTPELRACWQRGSYSDPRDGPDVFEGRAPAIGEFWLRQKKEPLIKTCAKLHKVRFVHGDLTDLAKYGKFGLVYLSNALESNHRNRDRRSSIPAQVARCLKPEGYVLASHSVSAGPRVTYPSNWEVLNSITPTVRSAGELGWTYNLLQVHPVAA